MRLRCRWSSSTRHIRLRGGAPAGCRAASAMRCCPARQSQQALPWALAAASRARSTSSAHWWERHCDGSLGRSPCDATNQAQRHGMKRSAIVAAHWLPRRVQPLPRPQLSSWCGGVVLGGLLRCADVRTNWSARARGRRSAAETASGRATAHCPRGPSTCLSLRAASTLHEHVVDDRRRREGALPPARYGWARG